MAILSISANIVFFLLPRPQKIAPEKKISTVSNIQEFGKSLPVSTFTFFEVLEV
jgi:hypothetical protein